MPILLSNERKKQGQIMHPASLPRFCFETVANPFYHFAFWLSVWESFVLTQGDSEPRLSRASSLHFAFWLSVEASVVLH